MMGFFIRRTNLDRILFSCYLHTLIEKKTMVLMANTKPWGLLPKIRFNSPFNGTNGQESRGRLLCPT